MRHILGADRRSAPSRTALSSGPGFFPGPPTTPAVDVWASIAPPTSTRCAPRRPARPGSPRGPSIRSTAIIHGALDLHFGTWNAPDKSAVICLAHERRPGLLRSPANQRMSDEHGYNHVRGRCRLRVHEASCSTLERVQVGCHEALPVAGSPPTPVSGGAGTGRFFSFYLNSSRVALGSPTTKTSPLTGRDVNFQLQRQKPAGLFSAPRQPEAGPTPADNYLRVAH